MNKFIMVDFFVEFLSFEMLQNEAFSLSSLGNSSTIVEGNLKVQSFEMRICAYKLIRKAPTNVV